MTPLDIHANCAANPAWKVVTVTTRGGLRVPLTLRPQQEASGFLMLDTDDGQTSVGMWRWSESAGWLTVQLDPQTLEIGDLEVGK